jgi:hypothetical protein
VAYAQETKAFYAPAPMQFPPVAARCEDESVCETFVFQGRAMIAGKREGVSTVTVDFSMGPGAPPVQRRLTVTIKTREPHEIAPGRSLQGKLVLADARTPEGGRAAYLCGEVEPRESVQMPLDLGDVMRGEGRVFRCYSPVKLPSGNSYLAALPREKDGTHAAQDWLYACAHTPTRSREPTALWIYRGTGGYSEKLTPIEQRGEARDVCGLKPKP